MTGSTLAYFLAASAALTVAPGPDNTFVAALGVSQGRRAAVLTALGMCSGITVHTTAAALGVSALVASYPRAFEVLKLAGAAYLLYLAWRALQEGGVRAGRPLAAAAKGWVLFCRGFFMNVINPKVALFFLAFLPQFVPAKGGAAGHEVFLLGLLFMAQAVVIFCTVAYLAGTVGELLGRRPAVGRGLNYLSAAVLAALGLRLFLAKL